MRCIGVALIALLAVGALAQTPVGSANRLDAVWAFPSEASGRDLPVVLWVDSLAEYPASAPVPFTFNIKSMQQFKNSIAAIQIENAAGETLFEGSETLDIFSGPNACKFSWDASGAACGTYSARFTLDYADEAELAECTVRLIRVTDGWMASELEAMTARIERCRHTSAAASDAYLKVRTGVADVFAERARVCLDTMEWRTAYEHIMYLLGAAPELEAELAFNELTPELSGYQLPVSTAPLEVRDGVLCAEGKPVFLFGASLDDSTPEMIARLAGAGLHLAVVTISPADSLTGPETVADVAGRFGPALDAARDCGVRVVVQLDAGHAPGWAMDAYPDMMAQGFCNLAHPEAKKLFERHVAAVVPYISAHPAVVSVSLTNAPRFRFEGEDIRQAFIADIKARYPDLQDLNRLWKAHLGSYDEIAIWADAAKEWEYTNGRAYQFDWQEFHRARILELETWMRDRVRAAAPRLLIQEAMADSVFDVGETRMTPDRETTARLMDVSGSTATTNPNDSYYALSYPRQSAFYALMRSFEPGKPVFNLGDRIEIEGNLPPSRMNAYVRGAMWEAVMSGLDATALAAESPVLRHPEALEAFLTANLDINRLAPIVAAFQEAPADVVILYSESSKIIDGGDPHLASARFAFEGSSFAGYNLRFITEKQIVENGLDRVKVLVIPQTPALADVPFGLVSKFADSGGAVVRVGTPIPYNERGVSRADVVRNTAKTVLVRGLNLPTEYLHAMDMAMVHGSLPAIPRPINVSGYPLEGVRTRYVEFEGGHYLYIVNLRKEPVVTNLAGNALHGRDLLLGRDVSFPMDLPPLDPMLIRLENADNETPAMPVEAEK